MPSQQRLSKHDVPCLAYSLSLRRAPRFDAERARTLGLPIGLWSRLQDGEDVTFGDRLVRPEEVLGEKRRGLRMALVTDTVLTAGLVEFVRAESDGVDLLISEGMYGLEGDKPARWESLHMTFAEAAALARGGRAGRLWLTHFGPSLSDPSAHLDRAKTVFPRTIIGYDGLTEKTLSFED